MNDTDRIIYRAFEDAPYNGFQSELAMRHAARACGVSLVRVAEAIHAANPGLHPDAFFPRETAHGEGP